MSVFNPKKMDKPDQSDSTSGGSIVAIAKPIAGSSSPVDRRMGLDQDKAKKISDSFKKVF
jgi:hypothetical protein